MGCSGVLWTKHSILVHQIKQQVAEGTISDVVHLPVKSWKVIRSKQSPYPRRRRQVVEGSAYDDEEADDEDYNSGYDEYEYEGGDVVSSLTFFTIFASPFLCLFFSLRKDKNMSYYN